MKALLINTSFYPQVGGVENSLRSISEILSEKKWEVDVVCGDNGKYPRQENLFKANIFRYKQKSKFKLFYLLSLLKKRQLGSYDLIVSRHIQTTLALLLLGAKNVKYIAPGVYKNQNAYLDKGFSNRLKYKINVAIESYVIKNCSNIYVFSDSMRQQINEIRPAKALYSLKPGVDKCRFFPTNHELKISHRKKLELPIDKKIILYLGRFADVKNIEVLVEAFNSLPDDFLLLLVGDGALFDKINQQVIDLKLTNKVYIRGKTNQPECFYRSADIYCLPSTYEPFGQVLLEATFSFLPIVALDSHLTGVNTASKEIYENFPSLISYVHRNSPIAFAEVIKDTIEKSIVNKEFDSFTDFYSWSKLVDDLVINN